MKREWLLEVDRLLTEFGNAQFECGAWDEEYPTDELPTYEHAMARTHDTRLALLEFLLPYAPEESPD